MFSLLLLGGLLQLITPSFAGSIASAQTCTSFKLQNADNAVVTGTSFYNAGQNVTIFNQFDGVSTTDLPAFCRVELVITTNSTANSSAKTEVWLPQPWNGRLLTVGNGGFGGAGKWICAFDK